MLTAALGCCFSVVLIPASLLAQNTPVLPILECVHPDPIEPDTMHAFWGYFNANDSAVQLLPGSQNYFSPGLLSQGQPVIFLSGLHNDVFSTTFDISTGQTWILNDIEMTASSDSDRCIVPCWDIDQDLNCDLETEDANGDGQCDALDCQGFADLNPLLADFGDVEIDQTSLAQTITLENTGTADLQLGSLAISGTNSGDFTIGNDVCSNETVDPGSLCYFNVTMTPTATGGRAAQVDIPSDALTSPDFVELNGVGIQRSLEIAADSLNFGTHIVGATSTELAATLQNTGTANVDIYNVSLPGTPFAASGGSCGAAPFILVPGASCTLGFTFSPTEPGQFSDFVMVTSNAEQQSQYFTLSGKSTSDANVFADRFQFP